MENFNYENILIFANNDLDSALSVLLLTMLHHDKYCSGNISTMFRDVRMNHINIENINECTNGLYYNRVLSSKRPYPRQYNAAFNNFNSIKISAPTKLYFINTFVNRDTLLAIKENELLDYEIYFHESKPNINSFQITKLMFPKISCNKSLLKTVITNVENSLTLLNNSNTFTDNVNNLFVKYGIDTFINVCRDNLGTCLDMFQFNDDNMKTLYNSKMFDTLIEDAKKGVFISNKKVITTSLNVHADGTLTEYHKILGETGSDILVNIDEINSRIEFYSMYKNINLFKIFSNLNNYDENSKIGSYMHNSSLHRIVAYNNISVIFDCCREREDEFLEQEAMKIIYSL